MFTLFKEASRWVFERIPAAMSVRMNAFSIFVASNRYLILFCSIQSSNAKLPGLLNIALPFPHKTSLELSIAIGPWNYGDMTTGGALVKPTKLLMLGLSKVGRNPVAFNEADCLSPSLVLMHEK